MQDLTDHPLCLVCGDVAVTAEGGLLRDIRFRGVEVIRAVSVPVRDTDWGTYAETDAETRILHRPDGLTWQRRWQVAGGDVRVEMTAEIGPDRLDLSCTLLARRDLLTNRAGFCLLHPLLGVSGQPVEVRHPDGTTAPAAFPAAISPDQPVRDIAGLRHRIGPVEVALAFEGDVFEMEDQRNWSDASYKTYCRPIALPLPYPLPAGVPVRQRIAAVFRAVGAPAPAAPAAPRAAIMPEMLLAAEPAWMGPPVPAGCGLLLRSGPGADWGADDLARIAALGCPIDLEAVVADDPSGEAELLALASRLRAAGLHPRHVIALPAAYLRSYQPEGPWPAGASPADAAGWAARAFPGARIGAGMLTNFTELNRCRPEPGLGAYVTHGNAAIVHMADDRSVAQTLEALPDIFASARAIGGPRGYRPGLCAVAMRGNPYGAGLAANPEARRMTMTDRDPRQETAFAAAYALGVAVLAAQAGAEAVALAAPGGPFGLDGPQGPRPIRAMVAALAGLAGRQAETLLDAGLVTLRAGNLLLAGNLSPQPRTVACDRPARLWAGREAMDRAPGATDLPPGSVLIAA